MNKLKLLAGIILFGSLWGFSEVIVGTAIHDTGLPSGTIMTGFFALFFLIFSRRIYKQPGMQFGIALVAGGLRLFNPFVGCHLCSAIAIIAEGAIFEIIFYRISLDFNELKTTVMKSSMGVITAYSIYVSGYIITQILTPIVSGANFYFENLIVFMPNILGSGLIAAIIGGAVFPLTMLATKLNLTVKDKMYYQATLVISLICWLIVVGNWFLA